MAKKSRKTSAQAAEAGADEPAEDIVPQPDDDEEVTLASGEGDEATAEGAERTDEGEGEPEELAAGATARDRIAARYRELRAKPEAGGEGEAGEGEGEGDGAAEDGAGEGEPAARQPKPAKPGAEAPSEEIDIVVDGQSMRVKRSEYAIPGASDDTIKAIAQREVAAHNRLREANRLLDEIKAKASPADKSGDETATTDRTAPPETKGIDEGKLADIVERIQVGDKDEGQKAVRELIELAQAGSTADANQVRQVVQTELVQRETQNEIDTALGRFGEQNPDLVANQYLTSAAIQAVSDEMRNDIKALGVGDKELAPFRSDPRSLAVAYRNLRLAGHPLRTYDNLLGDTATKLREAFGIKPPNGNGSAQPNNRVRVDPQAARERAARKTQAQPQPRHVGVRDRPPQAPRPKTASEIVAEARRARGYAVTR